MPSCMASLVLFSRTRCTSASSAMGVLPLAVLTGRRAIWPGSLLVPIRRTSQDCSPMRSSPAETSRKWARTVSASWVGVMP